MVGQAEMSDADEANRPQEKLPKLFFLERISPEVSNLVLVQYDDANIEMLRCTLLRKRNLAMAGCCVEIVVAIASMALYDVERTLIVPVGNLLIMTLSAIGLRGAITLTGKLIILHGVVTTGIIIAAILYSLVDAVFSRADREHQPLPTWMVLALLLLPYTLDLFCSLLSLSLSDALTEFFEAEAEASGLLSEDELAQRAERMRSEDVCCVCANAPKNAVLAPCGHKAFCFPCAKLLQSHGRNCPICRSDIESVVRVYES